jgi:carbamoyltransferase
MPTYILGLSALYHDSAAALLRDGEIVAAAQEERFSRKKHDPRFPELAIEYCLTEGGIEPAELDHVVFYERPLLKMDRLLETYLAYAPSGFASFRKGFPGWLAEKFDVGGMIRSNLGQGFQGTVESVDHHMSHAASAFFPSPFDQAAILTLDAVGEWTTSSVGEGRGNEVHLLREMRFPHSVGLLYSAFTYYTGFRVNSGEYKVMGLAPYGEPRFVDEIRDHLVEISDDGSIRMDMSYFSYGQGLTMTSEKFHELFGGPPRKPESRITQKEMDLAASVQVVCEEIVLKAAGFAHRVTGLRNLVMAGGVALNCVANGRILREGPFDDIWIQPAAGDAGGALGAALSYWHQGLGNPRPSATGDRQKGSFLGPSFEIEETGLFLDSVGAVYTRFDDEEALLDQVAPLIAEEKVIGWFCGRMEYGPRALGARSIIGDARSRDMQQTMNLKIKFRESFRPFAPCVLREHVDEIFQMRPEEDSPYMLLVAPVREEWRRPLSEGDLEALTSPDLTTRVAVERSTLPAITHVDYSARVQTVDAERHGRFFRLMRRFRDLTGCPVIVNTSFNIRGEPIVCTPEDAYRCFMATDMDYLVVDDFLLAKSEQPESLLLGLSTYRDEHPLD